MSSMSPEGIALLKEFEGCRLQSYQDTGGVWTIGWGATGPDIGPGQVWTQAQADDDLSMRLSGIAQNVENMLVHPATQGQLDALIDFSYNEGLHALQGSTLLKLFNAGDLIGAARQFGEWDLSMYQGRMQILQGLVRRRTAECVRFCGLG